MAKKFVRGITDVKTINNQDYDTNNVNDLLSDGQYNYIHRKKGKTEEYHNLTDNIKTLSSDNTDLLAVTNNNKTTNTATLHPKHDAQKEQVLESTRNTVTIQHGENGTAEKTTVDTNPEKVLEHENLKTGDGLTTSFNNDETTIMFKATKKPPETNLNTLGEGIIRGRGFSMDQLPPHEPQDTSAAYITIQTDTNEKVQLYIRERRFEDAKIRLYYRFIKNDEVTEWREMVGDSLELNELLEQKEQLLESTRNTVTIQHGENGTAEKTTVDTNPEKVLEHENLQTTYGISKSTSGNTTTLGHEYTKVEDNFDLNNLENGCVRTGSFVNAPKADTCFFVSSFAEGDYTIQEAITLIDEKNITYRRLKNNGVWGPWREQVGDKSNLDTLLALKQDKITSNTSIAVLSNNSLRQLVMHVKTYSHEGATLRIYVKDVSRVGSIDNREEELNFSLKINQGTQEATFTLEEQDKKRFNKIITTYGVGSSVRINGCLFTLSDTSLTVTTDANTGSNLVITFSDII